MLLQIVTPRSMLEETAERIREWEIRNQGIAERSEGSESSGMLSWVFSPHACSLWMITVLMCTPYERRNSIDGNTRNLQLNLLD